MSEPQYNCPPQCPKCGKLHHISDPCDTGLSPMRTTDYEQSLIARAVKAEAELADLADFVTQLKKAIRSHGCGSVEINTIDGYDWNCTHQYEWTCGDCPMNDHDFNEAEKARGGE